MTFDATDRKAIREREKRAKQREEQRRNYTRQIMSDRFGREWMWDLLERCYIYSTPFVAGQPDATGFNCGMQSLGLQLLADIMLAAPADYPLMAQEAQVRNLANERRDSDNRSPDGEHYGSQGLDGDPEGRIASPDYDPYAERDPDLFQ